MLAWYHTVPKPPEGSRRAKLGIQAAKISRLERLKKDGVTPRMPRNPLPIIINRLIEIGLSEPAGMGSGPISWMSIDAWQRVSGVALAPWEARLIHRLSSVYVAEAQKAQDETCPPPWRAEVTQTEREKAEEALRLVLG